MLKDTFSAYCLQKTVSLTTGILYKLHHIISRHRYEKNTWYQNMFCKELSIAARRKYQESEVLVMKTIQSASLAHSPTFCRTSTDKGSRYCYHLRVHHWCDKLIPQPSKTISRPRSNHVHLNASSVTVIFNIYKHLHRLNWFISTKLLSLSLCEYCFGHKLSE